MKPRLLILSPRTSARPATHDEPVAQLGGALCAKGWDVYVAQEGIGEVSDSPDGVRFLPFSLSQPPCFGRLDAVVTVDNEASQPLRNVYEGAAFFAWPEALDVPSQAAWIESHVNRAS